MYYVFLVIFGILGAISRYSISLVIHDTAFPLATLLINVFGCFLLAFITQFLSRIPKLSSRFVTAIGTGFVGSFTTFSTFTLESMHLIQTGQLFAAFLYLLISGFGGFMACVLGYQFSKWLLIRVRKGVLRHAD
ncbi:fluoride efflux transporter CrcB [Sporolactobacillus nakayamae]|uniref:Fluoride-specific ion channel FluC n=1 Tax=Sporolactobacillus nakayamae TaxID=269670 RepID=A0A1I2S8R7_9BACL|nr:fluoride efflux transporter CrcB [Sporolactobacillus nakayamae]SFG47287.1 CrcB protein [Sporolactobacillus nakayamae]